MIPEFPQFKKLEPSDRDDIEKITKKYPPYSDFHFTSMWVWDIKNEMRISKLHDNLVVCFSDYLTGEPFYSFLGDNNLEETILALLELCNKEGVKPILKLVPEIAVTHLDPKKFSIAEERDHFDYIYPVSKVASYEGSTHKQHRQAVRFFEKNNSMYESKILDLTDKKNQKMLMELVDLWIKNKREKLKTATAYKVLTDYKDLEDFKNEYLALVRLFSAPKDLMDSLICFSVFVDGVLSGFMIDEKVSDKYCISHFGKMNKFHKGNLQVLMKMSAQTFLDLGVVYYNDEQDLGLENLRSSKGSYELDHFLKKYTVTLHS